LWRRGRGGRGYLLTVLCLQEKKESKGKEKATAKNAAHYSTGAVAQSLTSTVSAPVTENEAAILDADVLRYRQIKKKGYVRLHTNYGDLNLELHCDHVSEVGILLVVVGAPNTMLICDTLWYVVAKDL